MSRGQTHGWTKSDQELGTYTWSTLCVCVSVCGECTRGGATHSITGAAGTLQRNNIRTPHQLFVLNTRTLQFNTTPQERTPAKSNYQ